MRVIPNEQTEKAPEKKETQKPVQMEKTFNNELVQQIGSELFGVNFYTSIGIYFKTHGLCGLAEFYWKLAEKTMCIKGKIKEYLLFYEYCFTIPAIDKVPEVSDCFQCPVDYETQRIEELYKLMEQAPCEVTKGFIAKLIKKHCKLKHIVTIAANISANSKDMLLIQQEISKLICNEQEH